MLWSALLGIYQPEDGDIVGDDRGEGEDVVQPQQTDRGRHA